MMLSRNIDYKIGESYVDFSTKEVIKLAVNSVIVIWSIYAPKIVASLQDWS